MTIKAALFDLDGTITRIDTARLYVRYQRDHGEVSAFMAMRAAVWALQYSFGVIDVPKVAGKALAQLRGASEEAMTWRCDDWARRYVAPHIMDGAREAIAHHRAEGHLVAMVTGSTVYASRPLARALGIPHVVATRLEVEDGRFTGRVILPMCYADAKITLSRQLLDPLGITLAECVFYSDSTTDIPLLAAVGQAVCVNPDLRLAREAKRRRWPIHRW